MSIALSPQHLEAVYDCLRSFVPYRRWGMPPGEEVEFSVLRSARYYGFYIEETHPNGTKSHAIQVSSRTVGHLQTLMRVMAHEMIHMHQAIARSYTANTMHNAQFHRHARRVCEQFGFDYAEFV